MDHRRVNLFTCGSRNKFRRSLVKGHVCQVCVSGKHSVCQVFTYGRSVAVVSL